MRKAEREVRRLAKKHGLTVVIGKRTSHFKLVDASGTVVGGHSCTSSDVRAEKNLEAQIKRLGRRRAG